MFYLSFLIRDAVCCLEEDEEGEPVICKRIVDFEVMSLSRLKEIYPH